MYFRFEKLRVLQFALELASEVSVVTRLFPIYKKFGLVSQFSRTIDSVSLNISEGFGGTTLEFKNFLRIAYHSAWEHINCLYIARNEKYIAEEKFDEMYEKFASLVKQIQALRKSL